MRKKEEIAIQLKGVKKRYQLGQMEVLFREICKVGGPE